MKGLLLLVLLTTQAAAQKAPVPTPAPAELSRAILLETGTVPGENGPEQWSGKPGEMSARNIVTAALLPVLPDPAKSTGAAVVVAPGGGFMTLSWDHEGMKIARAFAARGIAAFVLKYRLDPTPRDMPGFGKAMSARMTNWIGKPGEGLKIATPPYAVTDGIAALRLVRTRSAEWKIDPTRVGMVGFSAGARTTLAVTLQAAPADRPAFIAPIYPPMERVTAPADAPPMFVAMAADDPLSGRAGFGLIESWIAAKRPIEFHEYQRSGHGFGPGKQGTTTEGWIEGLFKWIAFNGFLKAKS